MAPPSGRPEGASDLGRAGWTAFALPGKRSTQYRSVEKDGRAAIHARAEASASMWRKPVRKPPHQIAGVEFSWWVPDLIPRASVADLQREDAPARVIFAFDGDVTRLSLRDRMSFELAEALTGEAPPYATLMYVWDGAAAVDTVVINPRSGRVRKIILESGEGNLRHWRDYRRDLAADFRRAFGEDPGPLIGVAFMTDSDNTASTAQAWYGDVKID